MADVDAYRWAPSSLYNLEGHDIEATVLQMLRHASSSTVILTMLKSLRENDVVSESKYTCLQKIVLANTGAVYDADPTHGRPNQSLVLSHASFRPAVTASKAYLDAQLKKPGMRVGIPIVTTRKFLPHGPYHPSTLHLNKLDTVSRMTYLVLSVSQHPLALVKRSWFLPSSTISLRRVFTGSASQSRASPPRK